MIILDLTTFYAILFLDTISKYFYDQMFIRLAFSYLTYTNDTNVHIFI